MCRNGPIKTGMPWDKGAGYAAYRRPPPTKSVLYALGALSRGTSHNSNNRANREIGPLRRMQVVHSGAIRPVGSMAHSGATAQRFPMAHCRVAIVRQAGQVRAGKGQMRALIDTPDLRNRDHDIVAETA